MRAIQVNEFRDINDIELSDIPEPSLGPDQALVRVHAAGIGFVDGLKVKGLYQTRDRLPFIPGSEFAGVIEKLGDNVSGFAPGDRVMGLVWNGSMAEKAAIPASALEKIPEGIDFSAAAAASANYVTMTYALTELGKVKPGEKVLVLGASGGIGIAAIQLATLLGAEVIAAASSDEKCAFARAAGAHQTVNYANADWRETLKAITGKGGVDVAVDPVGGEIGLLAFRHMAWGGRFLVVGFASGEIPALPYNLPLLKGAQLIGVDAAQLRLHSPELRARAVTQVMEWLASGDLSPIVGGEYPLARFKDAFNALRGRQAQGKIIVRLDDAASAG